MKPRVLAVCAAFALTFLVHARAIGNDFVFFDDARFVRDNPAIDSLERPWRFFTDLDTTASPAAPTRDIYRPVRTLSYAVITALFGKQDAAPFHALAVLLHAGSAAVLTMLLLAAGARPLLAAAGALAFALHPATVEVTGWVCSLGDAWCVALSLLALLLWVRDRLVLAHVALLLALLSKEHAVVVPGLWLAWDVFLRPGRWRSAVVRGALPGLAVVIGFLVWRASLGAGMDQLPEPLGGWHMLAGLGYYAARLLVPHGPTFQARVPIPDSWWPVLGGLAVLALLLAAIWRGTPRTRLGAAWFLLALVPVSNVFVTLKIPTADRFLYLSLAGLALLVADAAQRRARAFPWVAAPALLLLGGLTVHRIGDWRDDASLLEAGRKVDPKSRMLMWAEAAAHARDAMAAMDRQALEAAEYHVGQAVDLYGRYLRNAEPEENTIQVWREVGDLTYAWGQWLERIDNRPGYVRAYGDALLAYLQAHRLQRQGQGRIIADEVRHVAERAVALAVRLAEPQNPEWSYAIKIGFELLKFLEAEFGADIAYPSAQLLIVYGSQIRASDPAKAREGFDQALSWIDSLEARGVAAPLLRGQALLYRAILKDRPEAERADLERAYEEFVKAANQGPAFRLRALFLSARTCCVIAKLFGDEEMERKGKAILDTIPRVAEEEGLRIPELLTREIAGERQGCTAR